MFGGKREKKRKKKRWNGFLAHGKEGEVDDAVVDHFLVDQKCGT